MVSHVRAILPFYSRAVDDHRNAIELIRVGPIAGLELLIWEEPRGSSHEKMLIAPIVRNGALDDASRGGNWLRD